MKRRKLSWRDGFTLMELLVVVAIIVVLLLFVLVNWKTYIDRGHDAQRKSDLVKIRTAFEEYFNDNNCYPPLTTLDDCGGNALAPYLEKMLCDPVKQEPYTYVPADDGSVCSGFRICAKLADKSDPDIIAQGCDPEYGCGWGVGINYCLTSGNSLSTAPGFIPGIPPTPTPTPTPIYLGAYACTPGGVCNNYGNPAAFGCPQSWAEPDCQNMCGNPALRCPE